MTQQKIRLFTVIMITAATLVACGGKKFASISQVEKAQVLEAHMSEEAAFEETQDVSSSSPVETHQDPTPSPVENSPSVEDRITPRVPGKTPQYRVDKNETYLQIIRGCRRVSPLPHLAAATAVTLRVVHNGVVKCQASGSELLASLKVKREIKIPNCNLNKIPLEATIELLNQSGQIIGTSEQTFLRENNQRVQTQPLGVALSTIEGGEPFEFLNKDGTSESTASLECEVYNASPLAIDLRERRQLKTMIDLSSQADGIDFDILGENAKPQAHAKNRISWFNESKTMMIVLPNARGEVNGIDELFGDNTKGPDGRFATDGFAALAKFDSNRDTYITKEDAVFEKLRLWSDQNLDGIAQKQELFTLSQYAVTVIDLNYDPHYYQRDRHGNEFKFKSVAQRERDGKKELRPIFDIWFRIVHRP